MSFKTLEHKRRWATIDARKEREFAVTKWTQSGKTCLELNADCNQCPINKAYGMNRFEHGEKKCWQQVAVQRLLDMSLPISLKVVNSK